MKLRFNSILILLFLTLIFCQPLLSTAQEINAENTKDSTSVFVQDAKHFVEVGFGLLAAPFMFDGQDWARVGLAAGGTAVMFAMDKHIKDFALRNQTKLNDAIFDIDSYQGNHYSLFLAWGIYGYGALAGNNKIRRMGLHATEAFVYSGAISGIFKIFIGRRRPYAGDGYLYFRPFRPFDDTYQSLPSGHTTVSFAVSTALAKSIDNVYWKVFWYGTAGLVGASRVYHNKHWLSDVFLGAVIGYYTGDYVVGFDKKEKPRIFGKRVQPWFGVNVVGLNVYLD